MIVVRLAFAAITAIAAVGFGSEAITGKPSRYDRLNGSAQLSPARRVVHGVAAMMAAVLFVSAALAMFE